MPRKLRIQTTESGWTIYRGRTVIGWVRAAGHADPIFRLTPGTYWAIGLDSSKPLTSCTTPYGSVHIAARALERRWNA